MAKKRRMSQADWDSIQSTADDMLQRLEVEQELFVEMVSQHLPWFDGSSRAWARLRGLLTTKLGEGLDYWLDRCDEKMLLGFVEAIAEEDQETTEYTQAMKSKDLATLLGVEPRTLRSWKNANPQWFKFGPGSLVRMRMDVFSGQKRKNADP